MFMMVPLSRRGTQECAYPDPGPPTARARSALAVTFPERSERSVALMGGGELSAGQVPATATQGLTACSGGGQAAPAFASAGITALPAKGRS
jgi:hypothetical protein